MLYNSVLITLNEGYERSFCLFDTISPLQQWLQKAYLAEDYGMTDRTFNFIDK